MGDILGDYLRSIGRIPLLTDEEVLQHCRLVRAWLDQAEPTRATVRKGRRALERMVNANLRLVVSIVSKYRRRIRGNCIDMMDLIQAGNLGLITAVERFDPARGYRFSTYGYWWIRQAVTRYIHENDYTIRVPHSLSSLKAKLGRLQAENGGTLSSQEASLLTGEDPKRVAQASLLSFYNNMVSLDQNVSGSESAEFSIKDTIASSNVNEIQDDYRWMEPYLLQLSPFERQVLDLRFSNDQAHTLVDISRLTGKTRHHIQAAEGRALSKLRRELLPVLEPC